MSIKHISSGSVSGIRGGDTPPGVGSGEAGIEPDKGSPPSSLRGLPRFERGLRKVLPRPLANSLPRLAPRQWAKGAAADATPRPTDPPDIGREFAGNRDSAFPEDAKLDLVDLAKAVEGFRSETALRAEIAHILDECESGRAALDGELAAITFRLIASLRDTPRDDLPDAPLRDTSRGKLLDRALDLVCDNQQLNVSPQALTSNEWRPDEQVWLFERMYPVVIKRADTPERAAQLATLAAWIDHFPHWEQYTAVKKVVEAIRKTDEVNRFEPLMQLQRLADNQWSGRERGPILVLMHEVGGASLSAYGQPDAWRAHFSARRG